MKSILTLTAYAIHKTTEYGLPVEKKLTEKVVFIRKLNLQEKWWCGWVHVLTA